MPPHLPKRHAIPFAKATVAAALGVAVATSIPATLRAADSDDPTTPPATAIDGLDLAQKLLTCDSPTNSNLDYGDAPPYPPAWHVTAARAWEQNADGRAAFRLAATRPAGHWTARPDAAGKVWIEPSLNRCRYLAVDLGDAAVFAAFNGRSNEAFDLFDDMDRLSALLKTDSDAELGFFRTTVGVGIDSLAVHRLRVASTMLDLSPTAADPIPTKRLTTLIANLTRHPTAEAVWNGIGEVRRANAAAATQPLDANAVAVLNSHNRTTHAIRRVHAERAMLAVAFACLLYQRDTGHWPDAANALVPKYISALPLDPFADPPAPVGYRLVKGGLPDGTDRPLVYSVEDSTDGLSFTDRVPLYWQYTGDGDTTDPTRHGHHGQFRDIAAWRR